MRNVAILVDGGFYLKRCKKPTETKADIKQIVRGLITHCLKHVHYEHNKPNKNKYIDEPERLYRISNLICKNRLMA